MRLLYLLVLACSFLINGSAQKAERFSEEEIKIQEKFLAAKGLLFQGKHEEAVDILKDLVRQDPNNHTAQFELARAYRLLEDHDLSRKHIQKALNQNPDNEWYLVFLADHHQQNQELNEAITVLQKLVQLKSGKTIYYDQLSHLYILIGNSAAALSTYDKLELHGGSSESLIKKKFEILKEMNNSVGAEKELLKLTTLRPGTVEPYLHLGKFYEQTNQQAKAIDVYKKALSIDQEEPTAKSRLFFINTSLSNSSAWQEIVFDDEAPLEFKIKAMVLPIQNLGPQTDSIEVIKIERAVKHLASIHPDEAVVFALEGDLYYQVGDLENAKKSYSSSLAIDNKIYTVWIQLMDCLKIEGDSQTLLDLSEEAVDYFPNQPEGYFKYAEASIQLKDYATAQEWLSDAQMVSGENEYYLLKIDLMSSILLILKGAPADAEDLLAKSQEKVDSHPSLYELLGDAFKHLGDNSKALDFWKKAQNAGFDSYFLELKIQNQS